MLRTKGSLTRKPSKASLKSRGLHSSTALRLLNKETKTPSQDGRYSLYSTDSEDNIAVVDKGLDKCAELLTNILEIKSEKDIQRQHCQPMFHNTKKQKCDLSSKRTSNKEKAGGQKLKRKSRTGIHVPRNSGQSNVQSSKPAYNKHVASSTPVSMVVQRQRQQELKYKESLLQKQIQILQAQYENLQKEDNDGQSRQDSDFQIHAEILPQLLMTHEEQVCDENSHDHQPRTARKSLEFPSNAEKPLIDKEQSSTGTSPGQSEGNPEEGMQRNTVKTVQFVGQNLHEGQEENQNPSEISQSDLGKADDYVSSSCASKIGQHGGKRQINQCKKDNLQQLSPHKNTDHLRIVTYLVGELKAVLGTTDVEVERLLMEIENEIHLLSYTMEHSQTPPVCLNAGKQHDIDTEVALQPLRSENSDLRRKLRIANQRMREMENQCREIPKKDQTPLAPNKELFESLHHQLVKERKSVEKFRHEVQLAEKRFVDYNKDKLNLEHIVSEKEKDLHALQQELQRQKGKTMTADTQAKLQLESIQITLNAKNKEVGLLHIALEQRDAEIGRLTELTRGLQQSLTRVLSNVQELHPDDVISDVSTISSVFDTRQAFGQKTLRPRAGVMTSSQFAPWNEDFYDHTYKETHPEEQHKMSEYDKIKEDVHVDVGGESSQHDSTDDASTDEFVFKQELANLDTVIARLQDSLRDKV